MNINATQQEGYQPTKTRLIGKFLLKKVIPVLLIATLILSCYGSFAMTSAGTVF